MAAPSPAFSADAEQIPIRAIIEQYETNWNQGNGKALAGLFQPDADIGTMATGSVTAGRPKVEEMWAQSFGRRPQNFSTRVDGAITSIRFLRPEIAIVDGTFDYWPNAASERRTPPAAQERFSMTLVKAEDFRLLQGQGDLTDYQHTPPTLQAPFLHFSFCSRCGVRAFTRGGNLPSLGGEFYAVNVACLDDASDTELSQAPIHFADGRNDDWQTAAVDTKYL